MLDKTKVKTPSTPPAEPKKDVVIIKRPNFQEAVVTIRGNSPLVQNNMSQRAIDAMKEKQLEGSQASKKNRKKDPKDFDAVYLGSMHKSTEGWNGHPTAAIRKALISACRTVGFAMTLAKLSLFVEAEGYDDRTGEGLFRIHGEPRMCILPVRLASGVADLAARAQFTEWHAKLRLKWDGDIFSASDVINLLARAGLQVGIGAGRPDSKETAGMGFGTFVVEA